MQGKYAENRQKLSNFAEQLNASSEVMTCKGVKQIYTDSQYGHIYQQR